LHGAFSISRGDIRVYSASSVSPGTLEDEGHTALVEPDEGGDAGKLSPFSRSGLQGVATATG
jgi:hypothetical protein